MSFVRPEVQQNLHRWREALIGAGVLAVGLWGAATTFGITRWVLVAVAVAGAIIIWGGIRRALFPAGDGGIGVVEVDERQITYLSPVGGGAISIEDLIRVEIATANLGPNLPDMFWTFTDSAAHHLTIPSNAKGTDKLFEVLSVLNRVNYGAITQASTRTSKAKAIVWQKHATTASNLEFLTPRS